MIWYLSEVGVDFFLMLVGERKGFESSETDKLECDSSNNSSLWL